MIQNTQITQLNIQIENLISSLRNVQNSVGSNQETAQEQFASILNNTLENLDKIEFEKSIANADPIYTPSVIENSIPNIEKVTLPAEENTFPSVSGADTSQVTQINLSAQNNFNETAQTVNAIPSWVDMDYGFDPTKPRRPNMREFMEAVSDRNIEDLYGDAKSNWQDLSRRSSELLFGVLGTQKNDTRDWQKIMNSADIVKAARQATGELHKPTIDIVSDYTKDGILFNQAVVIKDSSGKIIRAIEKNAAAATETMDNFGVTSQSIPDNLASKVNSKFLSPEFVAFLENFKGKYENLTMSQMDWLTTADALSS